MMKNGNVQKGIYILSIIVVFLISALLKKNSYDNEVNNIFNQDDQYIEINLPQIILTQENVGDLGDVFSQLNKDESINILGRLTNYYKDVVSPGKVNPYLGISDITFYVLNNSEGALNIDLKEKYPSVLNRFFYTDINFAVKNLSQLKKEDYRVTTFFIEKREDQDIILSQLVRGIKQKFDIELTTGSLINTGNKEILSLSSNAGAVRYLVISIFFIIILYTVYLISELRRMSILRLHGYSIKNILIKLFFFRYATFILLSSAFMSLLLFGEIQPKIIFLMPIYLIGLFIVSFIFIYLQVDKSLKDYINNNSYSRGLMWTLQGMKLLTLVVCVTAVLPFISLFNIYSSQQHLFEGAENYAVFYPQFVGKKKKLLINGVNYKQNEEEDALFEKINQDGGLYFDNYGVKYAGIEGLVPNLSFPFTTVDLNYIEMNPIYTVKNELLKIDSKEVSNIVLIPEKFNSYLDELIHYYNINDDGKGVIFFSIKDDQDFFDLNSNKNIDVPIVLVLTNKNFPTDTLLTGQGSDDASKILIQNSVEYTYENLLPFIKSADLDDELLSLIPLDKIKEFDVKMEIGDNISTLFFSSVSLIVLVFVIYFTLNMHFYTYGRLYAIKRVSGYSIYRTYKQFVNILLAQYIFIFLFLLSNKIEWAFSFITVVILLSIEIGITFARIQKLEKENIKLLVKE